MAARGIATTGGVIDAGYRGEILVLMTNLGEAAVELKAGEKIAQMIPVPVLTGTRGRSGESGRVGAGGEGIWKLGQVRQSLRVRTDRAWIEGLANLASGTGGPVVRIAEGRDLRA